MKKIRNKILAAITLCVLIMCIIVGGISIYISSQMIQSEYNQKLKVVTQIQSNRLNDIIVNAETTTKGIKSIVNGIVDPHKLRQNLKGYQLEIHPLLKSLTESHGKCLRAYVFFNPKLINGTSQIVYEDLDGDNRYSISNANAEYKKSQFKVDYNMIKSNKGIWSQPYTQVFNKNETKEIVSYIEPIYKNGVLIGLAGVNLDFKIFEDKVNNIKIGSSGYAFLLDDKDDYIVNKISKKSTNLVDDINKDDKTVIEQINTGNLGVSDSRFDSEHRIISYSHLTNGWILLTSVNHKEAVSQMKSLLWVTIIIIVIGMLFCARIAVLISRRISTPVVMATKFAEEIAAGNLDEKLEIVSKDETKILAMSLNKAAAKIKRLVKELKLKEEKLTRQIENLKASEETISILAFNNSITDLPNRNYLMMTAPSVISKLKKAGEKGAIIYLDIDNFKIINDTLGHATGDKFLKEIANKFTSLISEKDCLFHMGADEFLFIIPSVTTEEVEKFVSRIYDLFKQPITIENDKMFYITTSIGIAIYPEHGKNIGDLLRNSDTALFKAKSNGKSRYEVFNDDMNSKVLEKIEMENKLRQAVRDNEFVLYYQPKVDTMTGKVVSMEALVRWISPTDGMIPPLKFISLAEETGLIIPIGEFVLREACRQNKEWQDKGISPLRVAVNLSIKQLQQENLIDTIKKILKDTGLDSKYLELEITESVLMNDFESGINFLRQVKEMGIRVYLDDFGTGYSSLNYLRELPISSIKIDKSFIDNLTNSSKNIFIASSLIKLAHGIDLSVVAEGVEKEEQFALLKDNECDEIQGYYFSKPLSSKEFEKLVEC